MIIMTIEDDVRLDFRSFSALSDELIISLLATVVEKLQFHK